LCAEVPRLEVSTEVVLVMHYREVPKTTATGPLALRALSRGTLLVHGKADERLDLNPLFDQGRRVLLLYPSDDAVPLDQVVADGDPRPFTLVVPDGNWRQAQRAAKRLPGLERAERVFLPSGRPTEWGLRHEPKAGGLATFEAIARALGVLESSEVQTRLEALFHRMVEDTWKMRGVMPPPPSSAEEPLDILYRDDRVVCINKPAGALVHRGWGRDERPLLQRLRDQLGRLVYPVHRLDRATSGALLFALDGADARHLQEQFAGRRVDKRYLGLCRGHAELGRIEHALESESGDVRKPAVTDFRLLGAAGRYGLYEARPLTGRTHQIRRHLKHVSHPLIGDVRYGKGEHNRHFRQEYGFRRLGLHCFALTFEHPASGDTVHVHAPLDEEFRQLLRRLELLDLVEGRLAS
jgi:tRNA pseudouridine65 synthase